MEVLILLLFAPVIAMVVLMVLAVVRLILMCVAWFALVAWIAGSATVAFVLMLGLQITFLLDMMDGKRKMRKRPELELEEPTQAESYAGTNDIIPLVKNRRGVYVPR